MKKSVMMAVVGALVGLWIIPASLPAAELRGGVKIGLNVAYIRGEDTGYFPPPAIDMDWVLRFAMCSGGFITLNISENVSLQAEALITKKGSATIRPLWSDYPEYRYSFSMRYLEIPL